MALTEQEQRQAANRPHKRGGSVKGAGNAQQFQASQSAAINSRTDGYAALYLAGASEAAKGEVIKAKGAILFTQALDIFERTGGTAADAAAYLAYLNGQDTEPVINATMPTDPTLAKMVCTVAIEKGIAQAAVYGSGMDFLDARSNTLDLTLPAFLSDDLTSILEQVSSSPRLMLGGAQ